MFSTWDSWQHGIKALVTFSPPLPWGYLFSPGQPMCILAWQSRTKVPVWSMVPKEQVIILKNHLLPLLIVFFSPLYLIKGNYLNRSDVFRGELGLYFAQLKSQRLWFDWISCSSCYQWLWADLPWSNGQECTHLSAFEQDTEGFFCAKSYKFSSSTGGRYSDFLFCCSIMYSLYFHQVHIHQHTVFLP